MTIAELISKLIPDPWRLEHGFSEDLDKANSQLFSASSDDERIEVLNNWIGNFQPCLFGKIGAKLGLISYCILSEDDLAKSEVAVRDKIQDARLKWLQDARHGDKSGFVILVLSRAIAVAVPDSTIQELAQKITSLYLLRDIQLNHPHLDTIELELPGRDGSRWRWDVGVNYFCSQGDKRWWQDHRIPGGMALSMNSVGHMVRSGKLAAAMKKFEETMDLDTEGWRNTSIDSLPKALLYAMKTIDRASEAVSGRATELLPLTSSGNLAISACPVELPADISDKNFCEYKGFYHTDWTLPSEYFTADVTRPPHIEARALDFTYLFDEHLSNPDYINMGSGRQVAAVDDQIASRDGLTTADRAFKRGRSAGRLVSE